MTPQPHDYLPAVKNQYEALPYPHRDPQDEYKLLRMPASANLFRANHVCFGGRKNLFAPDVRVLDAGGGTGDAAIFMAEQLRGTGATVVHLDMSEASQAIAKERARLRGLAVEFVHASLLDIPTLGLEPFDYIVCSGVLHHLSDPAAGLAALRSVMKPEAGLFVMLYATYGRAAVYQMQKLLRMINRADDSVDDQLRHTDTVLKRLAPPHWMNIAQMVMPMADLTESPASRYDLLLHSQDRAYTIEEIAEFAASQNLHIAGEPGVAGNAGLYDLSSYFNAEEMAGLKLHDLPRIRQWAIAELMFGHITKHELWLAPAADTCADWNDPALVVDWNSASGQTDMTAWRTQMIAAKGQTLQLNLHKRPVPYTVTPHFAAFFKHIDGATPTAEVWAAAQRDAGGDTAAMQREWAEFCKLFGRAQLMFLRDAALPRPADHPLRFAMPR